MCLPLCTTHYSEVHSTRTRIETLAGEKGVSSGDDSEVHSTRTRIETFSAWNAGNHPSPHSEVHSTRTRIETKSNRGHGSFLWIQKYIPPEQGLKLAVWDVSQKGQVIQKYIPPEQGLKQIHTSKRQVWMVIQKYIPPEQGLKPSEARDLQTMQWIQKYIPPEQGLKLHFKLSRASDNINSEVHSTRTRIETFKWMLPSYMMIYSEVHSTRTRIETIISRWSERDHKWEFRSTFHQNKDWNCNGNDYPLYITRGIQKYIPPEQGLKLLCRDAIERWWL